MRNKHGIKIFNFRLGSYVFNEGGTPFNFMLKRMECGWIWYSYLFGWRVRHVFQAASQRGVQ